MFYFFLKENVYQKEEQSKPNASRRERIRTEINNIGNRTTMLSMLVEKIDPTVKNWEGGWEVSACM